MLHYVIKLLVNICAADYIYFEVSILGWPRQPTTQSPDTERVQFRSKYEIKQRIVLIWVGNAAWFYYRVYVRVLNALAKLKTQTDLTGSKLTLELSIAILDICKKTNTGSLNIYFMVSYMQGKFISDTVCFLALR